MGRLATLTLLMLIYATPVAAFDAPPQCFTTSVVDQDTGRGVPLVELKTTDNVVYWTDSNGLVVFSEPGLMDRDVFFSVRSDGYEFPADGFGSRGKALHTTPGGSVVLKLKRLNIAERLYRVTGEGIYRDTLLAGRKAPIKEPLLNAQVMGQDTVMIRPYRGKLFWIWGDTNRPGHPLGNFAASGATSELPGRGGLDPAVGVDLNYFTRPDGFVQPMADIPGEGPKWLFGLMTLPDASGRERLVARYKRMRGLDTILETGLVVFDDEAHVFRKLVEFPRDARLAPDGRPFRVKVSGVDYYYFFQQRSQPAIRVRADWEQVQHLENYEAFTCYAPGKGATPERDAAGKLVWGWKRNSQPMTLAEQRRLVAAGLLKPSEGCWQFRDIDTGRPIELQFGSVSWNAYRKRWIAILLEPMSTVYFAEADTPVGPWVYAKRVLRHEHYSFYWPGQHPEFDQDGGRVIYLEGTYSATFSDAPIPTPRYDYNQLMYRLRLDDPRLALPVAVYRVADGQRQTGDKVAAWSQVTAIDHFSMAANGRESRRPTGTQSAKTWDNPYSFLPLDPGAQP